MAVSERTTGTPQPIGFSRSTWGRVALVLRWIALVIAVVLFLIPFYLILRNALSTESDITAPSWTLFPSHLQWSNISELFNDTTVPMARALYNSAVVAILGTAGQLLLASMAGYGLARIPYKHADKIFYAIVATLMIPGAVTFIPSFIVVSSLGWVSSLRGLIIPTLFSGFAAFLFRQYFLGFPRELEEAARVDGATVWQTFLRIVLPLALPGIISTTIITFLFAWGQFLFPLVLSSDISTQPLTVVITALQGRHVVPYSLLSAGGLLSIAVPAVIAMTLNRYIVSGLLAGSLK